MRLATIATIAEGNRFLAGYLQIYNRRFATPPGKAADLHQSIPTGLDLKGVLCIKTKRALRNDFTVANNQTLYQVQDNLRTQRVTVGERLDRTLRITHQGKALRYKAITHRPVKAHETPKVPLRKRGTRPSPDHPWKKTFELQKKKEAPASMP